MNTAWSKAIKHSADPEQARHYYELLAAGDGKTALEKCSAEDVGVLVALFSGSKAQSGALVLQPQLMQQLEHARLQYPRRKEGFRSELRAQVDPLIGHRDYATALRRVREFKQRELVRIAARDLAKLGATREIILELSDLADVCLDGVWQICRTQLTERYGQPHHQDLSGKWLPTPACVVGLGKLGGQELNYSSDVDVVFVYSEEGSVFREAPGKNARAVLTSHQFFNKLAEAFVGEVSRHSETGVLYRIDLRLRPEGDSGPLSRSVEGYENYYAQWGQTWERMMLIKARGVAGDEILPAEFLEMIQPFRYPRSVNENVLREVAEMKDRIENEVVKADELERNVKLGRGGIREIEFVVQSQQLLYGGRQPFLQGAQTLPGLEKLVQYELLGPAESRQLKEAYCFLRDLEHRLQMEENLQTHTIPVSRGAQQRLARLMGFDSLSKFQVAHTRHREVVRGMFERMLRADPAQGGPAQAFPRQFAGAEGEWKRILVQHSFRDPEKAFRVLREFVEGPGYVHISPRTVSLAFQLLPRLFGLCRQEGGAALPASRRALAKTFPNRRAPVGEGSGRGDRIPLSDPDRVVTRLDSFIAAYGARATLFELWNSNPAIFELLLLLFDRSEFLAELAIRTPDLVDELVTSGRLRQRKSAAETLADLRYGFKDADQHLWLRRYHQAELMRVGLRDILGLADFEQYLTELSALADACLQYALEVVMRRHKVKSPPFVIIGLGKLGGAEIDYGSDLDILFVADSKTKSLRKPVQMAVEVMDLVSLRTEQGIVFQTDARLRPDGQKGLVVNTLAAYEDYYRQRAQLWEIQSLTRTRPVAGDLEVGRRFQKLAAALSNFESPNLRLAAFASDWRETIHKMRLRIQKERTPAGKDDLAIKTGVGGLMDAEFIAQVMCMEHGWQEANTLRALERGRDDGTLPDADKLIQNYRQLRRIEGILRRWSYEGETVLPDDAAPFYRVSVRCGFESPEAFRTALSECRRAIREVYSKVFATVE
jgi:glutamate-ammonia-ligase adenylyltransferase